MMNLSIYANATLGTGPRRPNASEVVSLPLCQCAAEPAAARSEIESEVARILAAAGGPGTSVQKAFDEKEASLRTLFARLSADERIALQAVLDDESDPLGFRRLSSERRSRVLSALTRLERRRVA